MQIDSLSLSAEAKRSLLLSGITQLNPPQRASIEAGLLDGRNIVVASPTASGKTLIAELAFLKCVLERRKKALYIVPLKALASEKYEDFKKYEPLGVRVAISVGDLDAADNWLGSYDLVIVTSEKLDSLLRHEPGWIRDVGLVVADEVHLLNDESRGPTLEVVLTRLLELRPQVLALSATIANAEELASWLNAKLVRSDYRPVALHKGVFDGLAVRFEDATRDFDVSEVEQPEVAIAGFTIARGKQALIFASSRRNAESIAERTAESIEALLSKDDKTKLDELSEAILSVPSRPTPQCEKLASCVSRGVAFHHAGLAGGQRKIIEDAFRANLIKLVSATPTLAAGLNVPAYRVLIRDVRRYHPVYGSVYIPVLEYHQMAGRAGRPKYDREGEAILIAKNAAEAKGLIERYINGTPEEVYSKLSVEPILRAHVLALIATHVSSEEALKEFFERTFFVHQFKDFDKIKDKIGNVLRRLEEHQFIRYDGERLEATRIGRRVAQLYLDPETAHRIIVNMDTCKDAFHYLVLVSNAREMYTFGLRAREVERLVEEIERRGIETPSPWDLEYDDFLSAFKTALVLEGWTEEKGEDVIYKDYGVAPGELRNRIESADWLLYATQELALLLGKASRIKEVRKVRVRVKYGVREELVPLVSLKGVGRVRARTLYGTGFTSLTKLKKASEQELTKLLGSKVTTDVMKQLRTEEELGSDREQKTLKPEKIE